MNINNYLMNSFNTKNITAIITPFITVDKTVSLLLIVK